jgi:hypothetical protein
MWSFVWWPHAIGHGHDPLSANVVWAPHGIDLSWVTAVPAAGFVGAPLAAVAGPVVAYNVLVLAAPALSAWTAYLLARRLTRSFWPSLAAGWIFGFSAYEIGHMTGHLNLVLTFLVPVCALLVLRRQAGEIGAPRFVVLLALALVGQFLISTELFLTLLLVGLLLWLLAYWRLNRPGRRRLQATVGGSLAALVLAAVVLSPYLVHAFVLSGRQNAPLRSSFMEGADVLNYVVPTRRIWLRPSDADSVANRFTATGAERGAYVGLPLLAVAALFLARRRPGHARAILGVSLLVVAVASLGPAVRVDGHELFRGPWWVPAKLPLTKTVIPARLTMYAGLLVALMAALWLADGRGRDWWRWTLVVLGIVLVLLNPAARLWRAHVPQSTFFSHSTYKRYLHRGETVLVFPYGGAGWSLLWQAQAGMDFRLVDGHMGRRVIPAEERWRSVYDALGPGPVPPRVAPLFRRFLRAHHVGAIVVAQGTKLRLRRLVETLRLVPTHAADVLVYRLPARGRPASG